jgi:hypothetical protein
MLSLAAVVLLAATGVGAYEGLSGTRDWMAAHTAFKEEERQVLDLVRGALSSDGPPRVVAFGVSAAIFHYTGWPVLDIYNHGEPELQRFLEGTDTGLLIVPQKQLSVQWEGTPSGARWRWLQESYALDLRGKAGQYSVYAVKNR